MTAGMIRKVGPGEQVDGKGQVTGTGGKRVIAGKERVAGCRSEVAGTGDQVRGHLVDRKGIHGFEEVEMWRQEGTEGQTVTMAALKRPKPKTVLTAVSGNSIAGDTAQKYWK